MAVGIRRNGVSRRGPAGGGADASTAARVPVIMCPASRARRRSQSAASWVVHWLPRTSLKAEEKAAAGDRVVRGADADQAVDDAQFDQGLFQGVEHGEVANDQGEGGGEMSGLDGQVALEQVAGRRIIDKEAFVEARRRTRTGA